MLAQETTYTSHTATGNCLLDTMHVFYCSSCGMAFREPRFKNVELTRAGRAHGYAMFQVTSRMGNDTLQ